MLRAHGSNHRIKARPQDAQTERLRVWGLSGHPKPDTLKTLKPYQQNPKPQTQNPKPQRNLHPKPQKTLKKPKGCACSLHGQQQGCGAGGPGEVLASGPGPWTLSTLNPKPSTRDPRQKYVRTENYVYVSIYIYMYVCMYVCMCICVYIYIYNMYTCSILVSIY